MKLLAPISLVATLIFAAVPGAALSKTACNRACLNGHTDRYLAALLKHDPNALPLSRDVKFTENSSAITIGEAGLWRTATDEEE